MAIHEQESFDTEQSAQDRAMYLQDRFWAYDAIVRVYKAGALWIVDMNRRNSCD